MSDTALPSKDELLAMAIAANPDFARLMAERAQLEAQMAGLVNPGGGGSGANAGRTFPVASPRELRAEQAEWAAKRDAITQKIAALRKDARYQAYAEWEEARAELAAKALSQKQEAKRQEAERQEARQNADKRAEEPVGRPAPKAKDLPPPERINRPAPERIKAQARDAYQAHFNATRPLDKAERLGRLPKMPKMEVFNRPKAGKEAGKSAPDFRPLLSEAKRASVANLDDRLNAARAAAKDKPTFSVDALSDRAKSRKDKREPMFDLDRARHGPPKPKSKPKTKAADDLDTRRDRAMAAKERRKSLLGRFT